MNYVQLYMGDRPRSYNCLVDTGAIMSIMHVTVAKSLKAEFIKGDDANIDLVAANGEPLN